MKDQKSRNISVLLDDENARLLTQISAALSYRCGKPVSIASLVREAVINWIQKNKDKANI